MAKISELEEIDEVSSEDYVLILDKDDTTMSEEGSNKKSTVKDFLDPLILEGPINPILGDSSARFVIPFGSARTSALDLSARSNNGGYLFRIQLHNSETWEDENGTIRFDPATYINDGGHYFSRLQVCVSGIYFYNGTESYYISNCTDEPTMISTFGDVDGPSAQFRPNPYGGALTRIVDFLKGVPIDGDMTPVGIQKCGHVLSVLNDGTLSFGPEDGAYLDQDTFLYRNGVNSLETDGDLTIGGSLIMPSTTKAFIPPKITKAQRNAIASPSEGMVIHQTDNTPGPRWYTGGGWQKVALTADP